MQIACIHIPSEVFGSEQDEFCDSDSCEGKPAKTTEPAGCKTFRMSDFTPDSPTIIFGEAHGRLGNQLLGYALLSHFRRHLGMEAYINAECRQYMEKVSVVYIYID